MAKSYYFDYASVFGTSQLSADKCNNYMQRDETDC